MGDRFYCKFCGEISCDCMEKGIKHKYDLISAELRNKMNSIVVQFSPENLTCDGELSKGEIDEKANSLSHEWFNLVNQVRINYSIIVDYVEFVDYIHSC